MKNNRYSTLSTIYYFFKIAFKVRPSYPILIILNILCSSIKPFLSIIFPSLIIEQLTLDDISKGNVILLVLIFALSQFALDLSLNLIWHRMSHNENMVNKHWKKMMGRKMMKMRFYHLENPTVLDQISKGQDGLFGYGNRLGGFQALITNFITVVSYFITLAGVIFIISQVNIWLVFILLGFVILRLLIQDKTKKLEIKSWEERKRINRENEYYRSLLSDFKYGKDIRLNKCKNLLIQKNIDYVNDTYKYNKKKNLIFHSLYSLDFLFNAVIQALTYGYVAYYFIKKVITLADYSLYVSSISQLVSSSYRIMNSFMNIKQNTKMMAEFRKFMDIDSTYVEGTKLIDFTKENIIEFKNVSFSYPGSTQEVLKNINIKIDCLKKFSIVGENGAGKSTFIKLLMRLYDPTSGVITLNGIDIKEYDINEYYKLFSIVFQDYQLIGFTLGENIASSETYDKNKIDKILSDVDFKAKIGSDLGQSMLKYFDDNGVELSGGESQKVAIARALFKDANVLILDEPTAALDPLAEFEIYNQFDKMTNNKTAIYISHRLSSCRICDKILVLENGQITQIGHHDELILNNNGKYYQMFKAQAKYYQDNNIKDVIKGVNINTL